jgi:hypothetical protein
MNGDCGGSESGGRRARCAKSQGITRLVTGAAASAATRLSGKASCRKMTGSQSVAESGHSHVELARYIYYSRLDSHF